MKPIKRSFGYSRKLSDGNYGSVEVSEGFEVELQQGDSEEEFKIVCEETIDRVNNKVQSLIKGRNLLDGKQK